MVAVRVVTLGLAAWTALGLAPVQAPRAQPDLSVKALVAASARYVIEYQERFAFLVADEHYAQQAIALDGTKTDRVMRGELFLTYLPVDRVWTALHDIAEVDGEPVTDRADLRALLKDGATQAIGRYLAAHNARFNIGGVRRNFNEPTFALIVLAARHRSGFDFSRGAVTTGPDGATLVSLQFTERDGSAIVRNPNGRGVSTRGTLLIEAATGLVRETFVTIRDNPTIAELSTTYVPDEKMGLWVPSRFTERYASRANGRTDSVVCEARYTNYRRFEVVGRIK
jgi:hypothetical protein